jgi:GNAT superfamily N-acetyltransferase
MPGKWHFVRNGGALRAGIIQQPVSQLKGEMVDERLKVTCRPARVDDTPDVLELTHTIWEGEDYVPLVWQDWLADRQGLLAVAEYDGRVLGTGKLTRLAAGQWWMEGLRTHPEYERRGIAANLHAYLVDAWLRNGEGALRLVTASFRKAVQHLCDQSGFTKVGEFCPYRAHALEGSAHDFELMGESQIGVALDTLLASPMLTLCSGLIDLGWEWCAPVAELLTEPARQGKVYWWRMNRGLVLTKEDQDDESEEFLLNLQSPACQVEDLPLLLSDCRRLANTLGYPKIEWRAPLQPAAMSAVEDAGFKRSWDASVYIYAREHPNQRGP